ncbi:MAG TPA: hypothetical protein VIX73_13740 [Kofleriaceae bacterium]
MFAERGCALGLELTVGKTDKIVARAHGCDIRLVVGSHFTVRASARTHRVAGMLGMTVTR